MDRTPAPAVDPDIVRFITREELQALLAAVPDGPFGDLDRAVFLTAAMTAGLARSSQLLPRHLLHAQEPTIQPGSADVYPLRGRVGASRRLGAVIPLGQQLVRLPDL